MGFRKIVKQLMKDPLPTEMPYEDVELVLTRCGYSLKENGSSHELFRKKGHMPLSVPKSSGQTVKQCYLDAVAKAVLECWDPKRKECRR